MKRNKITKKQRSNFVSLLFALSSLLFVSCEQVEDFSQETDGDAVKVVASINKMQTRVAYEDDGATNFINGDEICVQNILRESKNIATYTYTNNGTYNDPNMAWTTTDALVWNGGTAESQFQAWYPATASFDKFTLPTLQNDNERLATADWMTASTSAMVKPDDKTINLAFEHKLAKITVQITEFASQFGEDAHLFPTTTIYSLSDEYVTVNGGIKPIVRSNSATAIVCPGKYAPGSNLMEITISEPTGETYLDVPVNAFLTNTGLEAGKHYKFSLKVGKDAISITKVLVEPWTTKEIDGGIAEEVPPYTYDATTNTYKVYQGDYLQTAIDEAEVTGTAENPATVKIMADMEITGVPDENGLVVQNILVDAGVIILDLNGHLVKGMTDRYGINIADYATLTIDDSSESKQGKFMCKDHVLYMDEHAKLIINNGTFENWAESYDELEGVVLRGLGWDWSAIINGGTFVSVNYVIMMSATVEINGGTFIGENYALDISNGSNEPININGGSFVGGSYDLFIYSEDGAVPAFLSANAETGVGATFPGGLTIDYDEPKTLNDIIMDGVGYFDAEGNQITDGLDGTNIAGDVTVKRIH